MTASDGDWDYETDPDGPPGLNLSLPGVPELKAYGQSLWRRFTHAEGHIWYSPLDGLDLADYLNETGITEAEMQRDIATQARRDSRTETVKVTAKRYVNDKGQDAINFLIECKMRGSGTVTLPITVV
jgi:hypothetical protein